HRCARGSGVAPGGICKSSVLRGQIMFRAGDHVHHGPSDENWVLAFGDLEDGTGRVAPCGWPGCLAKAEDGTLLKAASDEEHTTTLLPLPNMRGSDFRAVPDPGYLDTLPSASGT